MNEAHPLLERVRFLSISANNLDEFFMVRVAGLKGLLRAGVSIKSPDGLTPAEQLARIAETVGAAGERSAEALARAAAALAENGIVLVDGLTSAKRRRPGLRITSFARSFPCSRRLPSIRRIPFLSFPISASPSRSRSCGSAIARRWTR